MTPSCDLPQAPATPPSAISSFLHVQEPRCFDGALQFTTRDFISRFLMTAVEGHERLNELAEDGLVANIPGMDVETWQLTRDGAFVLKPNRKRVTKKLIASAEACLKSMSPELLRQGVVEISMGGRPIAGKPNGQILVGIRLAQSPLSTVADGLLLQLCAALDTAVGAEVYAPMLFSEKIPLRLRDRTVIAARADLPELVLDGDELEQAAWVARFSAVHDVDFDSVFSTAEIPYGLFCYIRFARQIADLPFQGVTSQVMVKDEDVLSYCEHYSEPPSQQQISWDSWEAKLYGWLEYHAATKSLPQFVASMAATVEWPDPSFHLIQQFRDITLGYVSAEDAIAQALVDYRAHIRDTRESKSRRVKPTFKLEHLLFFDTLNFESPCLVGFVRQPGGHNAYVTGVIKWWHEVLAELPNVPISKFADRFNIGMLSLDVRAATAAEVAAFESVCKREETLFGYWLFAPGNRMLGQTVKHRRQLVELDTPAVFLSSTLGRAIQPRLLEPDDFGQKPSLREAIRSAPVNLREQLLKNVAFLDDVLMVPFARHAALKPCIDPLVLSSDLLDAWTFVAEPASEAWSARTGGSDWMVVIQARGGNLDLVIGYRSITETYPLARVGRTVDSNSPYDGNLGEIVGLFETGRMLFNQGLAAFNEEFRPDSNLSDKQKFDLLARELCRALHYRSYYRAGSGLRHWPYFPE